ncbi:unnamed protein product [Bathycoccus prasinos]
MKMKKAHTKMNNFTYPVGKAPCHFYGHCGVGVSSNEECHIEFVLSNMLNLKKDQHEATD